MPTEAEIAQLNATFDGKVATTKVETKVETPIVETPKVEVPKVETPKVETPKADTKVENNNAIDENKIIAAFLEKKTNGKYKDFETYEKEVLTPKELVKEVVKRDYADENIARWDEMARNGVKITRELLDLETKNFDSMDALQLHIESARLKDENKKYPDNILAAKIKAQYGMKDWFDEDGQPIPDNELSEDAKINKELFRIDSENNKEILNKYKQERTLFTKPDEASLKAMAEKRSADKVAWEKFVETEIEAKTDKFLAEVEDSETKEKFSFDFAIPDEVKKEATSMMKELKFGGNYFKDYLGKDEKGNVTVDDAKIYQDYVKARTFDKAVAASLKQGIALGKLEAEKRAKNTNFTAQEGIRTSTANDSLENAVRNVKVI